MRQSRVGHRDDGFYVKVYHILIYFGRNVLVMIELSVARAIHEHFHVRLFRFEHVLIYFNVGNVGKVERNGLYRRF